MSVNIYKKETDTLQKVAGNGIGVAKFGEPIANWLTSANIGAANSKIADADGMVIVNVTGSGRGVIYEDGETVPWTTLGSTGSSIVSPVRKGHKYSLGATASITISSCFFYPFKEKQVTNLKAEDKYSTDEIVVGEWIDGKPIYRKCFILTGSINASAYSSVGIIKPENFETLVFISTNSSVNNLYHFNNNLQMAYSMNVTVSVAGYVATLEYTKTTD